MAEEKRKRGRPPKVSIEDLINDADDYIASTPLPIIAEYAHQHGITYDYLNQLERAEKEAGREELSRAIKRIVEAKAIRLEKGAISGKFVPSVAIFSLKQLGWRDKPKDDEDAGADKVVIVDDFK